MSAVACPRLRVSTQQRIEDMYVDLFNLSARLHTLLGQCMKDKEANKIMWILANLIKDKEDGIEFIMLLQQWYNLIHTISNPASKA